MKTILTDVKNNLRTEAFVEGTSDETVETAVVNVFDDVEYQEILGFGGAFTESAAYNYALMDSETKRQFLKAYFDPNEGIGYNFGRTHINSCDFSLDIYSYVQDGDRTLSTFDISRDKKYIIPFLKDALSYCKDELFLLASPWSPPAYMKTNQSVIGGGKLLEEYKSVWALYYAKYIKAYRDEGINIQAISVQNEPKAMQTWESCNYTPEEEAEFIEKYLVPALDAEQLSDIKIIIWDHNKERVYDRCKKVLQNAAVNERVWGIGYHWYTGDHFDGLRIAHEKLGKPLLSTEFCGTIASGEALDALAERYGKEMCENFNNYQIASCDWNLLLSTDGGPFHNRTKESVSVPGVVFDDTNGGCSAPILYDQRKKQLVFTPIYDYIRHFAKYIRRGAKRLGVSKFTDRLSVCAFRNPNGEIVCVLLNTGDCPLPVQLRNNGTVYPLQLPAHSIMTTIQP